MRIIPLPSVRLRHALRVTAVVTIQCQVCGCVDDLDVIGLACAHGPSLSIQGVVKLLACSRCGNVGAGLYRAIGSPSKPRYDLRLADVLEPAATLTAHCRACQRQRCLDALALGCMPKIGPDVLLDELADRLRCEGCGQRGWVRIRLEG